MSNFQVGVTITQLEATHVDPWSDRTTPTGKMINSYLTNQEQQDDHFIHLLFSANRWEAAEGIRNDIEDGVSIVVDRYSYSGAVYSAAKKNPSLNLKWAWMPEIGLPEPDVVLFLNISAEAAAKRGGYGQERYEKEDMQARVRTLFYDLFSHVHRHDEARVAVIDAGRSIEAVATEIVQRVSTFYDERAALESPPQLNVFQEGRWDSL